MPAQKRLRLKESFNDFRAKVIPASAPAMQVTEMRRAFYAGAQSIICMLLDSLDDTTGEATGDDLKIMQDFQDEMRQFGEDVKAGRA